MILFVLDEIFGFVKVFFVVFKIMIELMFFDFYNNFVFCYENLIEFFLKCFFNILVI